MKAIGYAAGKLYRCRYAGLYMVVVAAPDRKTAKEAFELFLRDREHVSEPDMVKADIRPAKTIGQSPLIWAQVDVAAV